MKKRLGIISILILQLSLSSNVVCAQSKSIDPEGKLKELGITLITPAAPTASYVKAVRVGNLVYLSGHGPDKPEGGQITGKVGNDLTLEQGQEAARLVAISLLSSLKREIGDLNKVSRIVKVLGMVNAAPTFERHSQVINGCSDLMVQVFGEAGRHARSSVGMSSLPSNIAVEIEMIVALKE
jgi:enamine deaminase RidA (YjgF/YER057c/UK114 family)